MIKTSPEKYRKMGQKHYLIVLKKCGQKKRIQKKIIGHSA